MFKQVFSKRVASWKAIGVIVVFAVLTAGLAIASYTGFNIMTGDQEILRMKNQTQGTVNWSDPLSANAGDQIKFLVYYHCGTDDVAWSTIRANNVRVRLEFPTVSQNTIATTARIFSNNLATVYDTGTINASSSQKLTLSGTATWYHDGVENNVTATVNPGYIEVNLGDLECDYMNCFTKAGFVTFTGTLSTVLPPTVDIKANSSDGPITINHNNSALLSWTTANDPITCTAGSDWSGYKSVPSGSESTGLLTTTKTYSLTCSNAAGSASDSVLVQVLHCLSAPPTMPY